ncbi:MAG: AI-2E family transporter [Bdellovibrio sp.]|nr:MAG: AI-2E family transporter [Bdellovibrio sp.]
MYNFINSQYGSINDLNNNIYDKFGFRINFKETLNSITIFVLGKIKGFAATIPSKMIQLFILIITTFFMFRDGHIFLNKLKQIFPMDSAHRKHLLKRFNDVIFAVVYGQIITALIQAIIAGIGFFIFGVKSPLLWALVTFFLALIPFLGAAFVWLPISLYFLIEGLIQSDFGFIGRSIGLFLYGALIISLIDNFLKPKLISNKTQIHTLFIILGIISGISAFGLIGIILGPLILALFLASLTIIEREKILIK